MPAGVTLTVYDLPGRHIMTLMDESHDEGTPCMNWVAADAHSSPLASGVYFYQLRVGDEVETGRMTFLGQ